MKRTSDYRRKQTRKKITKRQLICRQKEGNWDSRWYSERGIIPWYIEKAGKLDKFNLSCSCQMCAAEKKGNRKERTPHRDKKKYGRYTKAKARASKGIED